MLSISSIDGVTEETFNECVVYDIPCSSYLQQEWNDPADQGPGAGAGAGARSRSSKFSHALGLLLFFNIL